MSFPPDVRVESLVRAARHCCVCHRYKGLKIEVHHIVQEADGGPNTLDNAIVLCADCHTDAGHYNPEHPRGTKFSPTELRLARDRWQETVRRGAIPNPAEVNSLYCRYLVCKHFRAIHEAVGGNLSDFPFQSPMLMRTPALDFLASIVARQNEPSRPACKGGHSFQSEEVYVKAHPDAKKMSDTFIEGQEWLHYERDPTPHEVREIIAPEDYVSSKLLETRLEAKDICRVRAITQGCGNVLLQEEYQLRPLWAVYLVITNDSGRRIRLVGLDAWGAVMESPCHVSTVYAPDNGSEYTIPFPSAEIPAGSTVILPVATILGPLEEFAGENTWTIGGPVASGEMQELSHGGFPTAAVRDCLYWGPVLSPTRIRFTDAAIEQTQEMYQLDLGNLYILDRYWEAGSCPHLFAITENSAVRYLGELFATHAGVCTSVSVNIEQGIRYLVLAEIEDERTLVHSVSQGDALISKQILLEKGDYFIVPIQSTGPVTLTGQYDLLRLPPAHAQKDFSRVRSLIRSFATFLVESIVPNVHLIYASWMRGRWVEPLPRAARETDDRGLATKVHPSLAKHSN